MDAVAPVMINVGGWGDEETDSRRRGRVDWAKLKRPLLHEGVCVCISLCL